MQKKATLKGLYSEIRTLLFNMIPEKWESIYLYASVIDNRNRGETGEMFFFYYPKSVIKKNPVNVYEIPSKFNINENEYMILATQLYEMIKKLRCEYIRIEGHRWSNVTISIENVEFLVEFNDDDLNNYMYNPEDRRMIWKYKYLDYPIEKLSKEERRTLNRYLEEEELGNHKIISYSETFYQKHIHNDITYNNEKNEYIQDTSEVKKIEENEKRKVKSQLLKLDN